VLSCDLSLITIHISDYRQFSDIHISQGSVATYVRYGETFKYDFVVYLPLSLPVKEYRKLVKIWGSYGQESSVLFFWLTVYFVAFLLQICFSILFLLRSFAAPLEHWRSALFVLMTMIDELMNLQYNTQKEKPIYSP